MTMCNLSPRRLPKIHDQESLTLCWRTFSRWGRERFTFSFTYKGSQYFIYDYLQHIAPQSTQDTWPRIVDTHFHDGAGSVLLSLLRIKAANTSFMTICNLSHPRLPKVHDQALLRLCWSSCSWWGRECFTFSFTYKGSQYFIYDYLQHISPQITQDTWPIIVDAPLTLHWRSFSWWGRGCYPLFLANKGSQYLVYDNVQPIAPPITQGTWLSIVEAPLKLMIMMGQGVFYVLLFL